MTNPKAELLPTPCPCCGKEGREGTGTQDGMRWCVFGHVWEDRYFQSPAHPETVRMREALKFADTILRVQLYGYSPTGQWLKQAEEASLMIEAALSLAPKDAWHTLRMEKEPGMLPWVTVDGVKYVPAKDAVSIGPDRGKPLSKDAVKADWLTKAEVEQERKYIEAHDAPNHAMPRRRALALVRMALAAFEGRKP